MITPRAPMNLGWHAGLSFMDNQPRIVRRDAQPYVAIAATVTMRSIAVAADRLPEVLSWVARRGIEATGAPFFRYDVIDAARRLQLQVGVPVRAPTEGEGAIIPGRLPAGNYLTVS